MSFLRKIAASVFSSVAYAVLTVAGWKKKTVEANLELVSQGTWRNETAGEETAGQKVAGTVVAGGQGSNGNIPGVKTANLEPHNLYRKILRNLTRHVGEMLFCFDNYKQLPEDCAAYPCSVGGDKFELAEGAAPVIEKMRKGGIFLTAHYGNYEASGAWLCALGVPLKASFIPLKPKWLNRYVYEKVRCVKGRPYSIDARTPREFLNLLDGKAPGKHVGQRELFCLLADQDSRISSALDGTFLGQPAKLNPLPDFLLKHRPETPVFFCWIEELDEKGKSGGCMRKVLHAEEAEKPDSRLCENESNARENDSASRGGRSRPSQYNSIVGGPYRNWLETRIKENPALWYGWTHKRFKSSRPEIYSR